jgi:hypothetical protein
MDPSERLRSPVVDNGTNLFEIALAVHREVWNEFYTWEHDACKVVMNSLAAGTPDNSHTSGVDCVDHGDSDIDNDGNPEVNDLFTVWEYDKDGSCTKSFQLQLVEVPLRPFKSYPKYEACTPTTRSMIREDQDSWSAPFAPFADDPSFPLADYLAQFESFRWQTDFKDPDCERFLFSLPWPCGPPFFSVEEIGIETTRRLFHGQGVSLDDLNHLSIIPQLRITNASGLVWDMTQRLHFSLHMICLN